MAAAAAWRNSMAANIKYRKAAAAKAK